MAVNDLWNESVNKSGQSVETATLYSTKKYSEVEELLSKKKEEYCLITNNCSDAVKFLLDFCFSEQGTNIFVYRAYQYLCSIPALLTCGLLSCIPGLPCMNTPIDVFKFADLLTERCNVCQSLSSAGFLLL